ncbi:MAG: phage N-6-adenine-methyltransferase [Acidobacteria bacterium]|nr:phage N-6-adenine-methyltransferase [Acidobacteriota bacterium]
MMRDESCTPPQYIEAAREVMDGIDLDPASSDMAQEIVRANHYWTAQDDGLIQDWHGRIWLNPPYSLTSEFVAKLVREEATIAQAIVLTSSSTDADWFHQLEEIAQRICFTKRSFIYPGGLAIFYVGDDALLFEGVFKQFGFIR